MENLNKNSNDPFEKLKGDIEKELEKTYSKKTIEYSKNPINMGIMTNPDGAAVVKGSCGDTMEIYMRVSNNKITDINFHTFGCGVTLACGSALTKITKGKDIYELLKMSPQQIITELGSLPLNGIHCAILAINTFFQALSDYLLKIH